MSKQQTFAPNEPERSRSSGKYRKDKPWVLWHLWHLWWRAGDKPRWVKRGRYQTAAQAKHVMAKEVRTYEGWTRNRNQVGSKLRTLYREENYRIMHEDEGKPT